MRTASFAVSYASVSFGMSFFARATDRMLIHLRKELIDATQYCIYLRKSRQDLEAEARGEGDTLARHRRTLTELAEARSLPVGAIYEEVVSGDTIAARPQMQRLLQEVEAGQWRGVIVMEIERLARGDSIDQGIVARAFKYSETRIITPFKTFDPTTNTTRSILNSGFSCPAANIKPSAAA